MVAFFGDPMEFSRKLNSIGTSYSEYSYVHQPFSPADVMAALPSCVFVADTYNLSVGDAFQHPDRGNELLIFLGRVGDEIVVYTPDGPIAMRIVTHNHQSWSNDAFGKRLTKEPKNIRIIAKMSRGSTDE